MGNYIIQRESKRHVRQWRFDQGQIIALAGSIFIILSAAIFLLSDLLSYYLYEQRLNEFRVNYNNVVSNLDVLKGRLSLMDKKITNIEDKDRAVRNYAGMPEIDQDIREIGIGGHAFNTINQSDNLAPAINKELAALEMNIDILNYVSNHNSMRPKMVIGFAAETTSLEKNAVQKLKDKNCDWIIANDVSKDESGFDNENNEVTIFYKNKKREKISKMKKTLLAEKIVERVISVIN